MKKRIVALCLALTLASCKKPFTPPESISSDNRYLVVEGVISGSNDSTFITLSRTKKVDTFKTVYPETGAQMSVENDANTIVNLVEIRTGIYASAPISLDASRKYRLRIKTTDGKEYASDLVVVKDAPAIDSIGFVAESDGAHIYVNAHDASGSTRYYRWEYREDWQFHTVYRSAFLKDGKPRLPFQQIYDCFAKDSSTSVQLASTTKLTQDIIYRAPLTIVASTSEKIEKKYCIGVRQYALTSDAYDFWQNLQKNTEELGSIFDVLPSQLQSNFHCLTNPNELVIGYLSVGNTSFKRTYITASQLPASYNPKYPAYCELDTVFNSPNPKIPQEVTSTNNYNVPNSPYLPIMAIYAFPDVTGLPIAFTYSSTICVDCTVRGKTMQPAFWK
jgi:hypothetical protein